MQKYYAGSTLKWDVQVSKEFPTFGIEANGFHVHYCITRV
jgi:hypothetical protein